MAMPMRLRRSVLFLPAPDPCAVEKARILPAEGLIFDLERRRRSGGQRRGACRPGGGPLRRRFRAVRANRAGQPAGKGLQQVPLG